MKHGSCGCVVMLLAAVSGCGPRSEAPGGWPAVVEVRAVDAPGLEAEIARHRGQGVLVDFWATWCGPCKELFGHNVELQRRYAGQGLVLLSLSLDDAGDLPAVRDFLQSQRSVDNNFISGYETTAESFARFQIPEGTVPCVKLYDRQGQLQATFGAGQRPATPEAIAAAVQELLKRGD